MTRPVCAGGLLADAMQALNAGPLLAPVDAAQLALVAACAKVVKAATTTAVKHNSLLFLTSPPLVERRRIIQRPSGKQHGGFFLGKGLSLNLGKPPP